MENYEQKYKEALGRANAKIETYNHLGNASAVKSICEIFPELKESEDEKIRKALICGIKSVCKDEEIFTGGFTRRQIVSWLEKQGEQKPTGKVEPKFKVGDKIKLAEEPKYPAREIIAIKNDAYCFDKLEQLPFINQDKWELVEQTPTDKIKQNPTWSEEDEKIYKKVKTAIDSYYAPFSKDAEEMSEWFKNLKDRYTWKPSNEQIETLGQWLRDSRYKCYHIIDLLYQDLKKLKGE